MSHSILSYLGAISFTIICLAATASAELDTTPLSGFNAALGAGMSYRIPQLAAADTWEPHSAGGLWLEMPTYLRCLTIRIGAEGGVLASKPPYDLEILMFHAIFTAHYNISLAKGAVLLRPFLGISNTTIYLRSQFELFSVDLFSNSENEVGPVLGLEPAVCFGALRVSVPVYGEYVFSSPTPFLSANVSFLAGVGF